ncbi:purple acid phosphatase family protein [Streptomyces spiramenti]|uniref:Metallophosphoesterase family protein n=1 Tax=Streptomyces spiramenti TaxID=2720606 RepID=A0ABX1APM4_9ACTN|nr:metallophosphoesterase family protein [Streptomyces spiramenti]NJP67348.1 metallophosphoesterase family protein [Streptomyces spiramenti]
MRTSALRRRHLWLTGVVTAGLLATAGATPAVASTSASTAAAGAPERVILNPTADPSTSQTVTWRSVGVASDLPASVELRHPDGRVETVRAAVTKEMAVPAGQAITFAAELTGLSPATTYAYRAVSGEAADEWNSFTTAKDGDQPFTFTWYADGQNDLTEKWTPIVDLTSRAFPNSELTIQSGDLIDLSVEDEWEEWFTITDGERQTENWLPAIGNHEYSRDAAADFWDAGFTVPDNGPRVPANASATERPYLEIITEHLRNQVYFTDYQGVRFVQLNSHTVSQNAIQNEQGVTLPALSTADWRTLFYGVQAQWLDQVLAEETGNWTVVTFHHPAFSVSSGRNNREVRENWVPVITEHDVDLVLAGHDHTYGRGFLNDDRTDEQGVTDGPVFVVSNSGPKYYNLAPVNDNVWTNNGATQLVRHAFTSMTSGIRVTPDSISYEALVVQKGNNPTTGLELGETIDSFTISRGDDGSKRVTEGIERRVATGLGEAAADPVEGDIVVEAVVPERDIEPGALTLTIGGEGEVVSLGEAGNGGDRWSFGASLPTLSVTDTRYEAAGWSVTGGAGDLTGTGGVLTSGYLGWSPLVLGGATAESGPTVSGLLNGGTGLAGSHRLAAADDHSRFGTTELSADLKLDVPAATAQGSYRGAVHVSLFPVD